MPPPFVACDIPVFRYLQPVSPASVTRCSGSFQLLLPCHVEDFRGPAFLQILRTLTESYNGCDIFIGLDGVSVPDPVLDRDILSLLNEHACTMRLFAWESPICEEFRNATLAFAPGHPPGKGLNLWRLLICALSGGVEIPLVVHDCDILTYQSDFPARLAQPLFADSRYLFCKGFASRYSDRLNGRVMRLHLAPLLRALSRLLPTDSLLHFLSAHRYPLSGETALRPQLAGNLAFPSGWGVDLGLLASVFNHTEQWSACCQVETTPRYDHKHRDLSADDANHGLHKMAREITLCILQMLCRRGHPITPSWLAALESIYRDESATALDHGMLEAQINGLVLDAAAESLHTATFQRALVEAFKTLDADGAEARWQPPPARVLEDQAVRKAVFSLLKAGSQSSTD